ncbi:MAG: DMT family transporter, partial [Chloroflexota bacterium]
MSKTYLNGMLLGLLAIFCLSLVPILVKVGLEAQAQPIPLLTMRLVVAAAVLWAVFLLFQPAYLHIDQRGLLGCLIVATANVGSLTFFYSALPLVDASVAHVMFSAYPIFVLLLLFVRGETLARIDLLRLALALLGVYLLVGPGGMVNTRGIIFLTITTFAYALHLNSIQWFLSDYPPQTIAVYVISLMAVMLSVIYSFQFGAWQPFSWTGWAVVLATGLLSTVVARLAMFASIQRIGSGQLALLGPLETLLAVFLAILFLGERLGLLQWAGTLLILVSTLLVMAGR